MDTLYAHLQQTALAEGASLFGVADLASVATDDFLLEPDTIARLHYALSVAVRVSPTVLDTIREHPNALYFHHYRQLNGQLDRIALRLAQALEASGHAALPIAASQIVDWKTQRAHLSHKRIAIAARLGWLGRNNLLVTPEYGAQVRLVTVLTDCALTGSETSGVERPASSVRHPASCVERQCRACLDVCPARAIRETPAEFDHQACFAQLKEFQRQGHVGQYICGICVRVCRGGLD